MADYTSETYDVSSDPCPRWWAVSNESGRVKSGLHPSLSFIAHTYLWAQKRRVLRQIVLPSCTIHECSFDSLSPCPFIHSVLPTKHLFGYPMGFFAKSLDGRIDNPEAGWKGRGLWSTYATRAPWHIEGGECTTSKAVKFQLRPDALAN